MEVANFSRTVTVQWHVPLGIGQTILMACGRAIENAVEHGNLFVAAAGNKSSPVTPATAHQVAGWELDGLLRYIA